MANYEFNAIETALGKEVIIYVGGKTSTTSIDANITSMSKLTYDMSRIGQYYAGSLNIAFDDFSGDIETQLANIKNQVWIIEVDATEYFRGYPLKTGMAFSDEGGAKVFSLTLGSSPMDANGVDFTSLTKKQTNYWAIGQVLERVLVESTGLAATDLEYVGATISYTAASTTIYLDYADAPSGLAGTDYILINDNEPKRSNFFNRFLQNFGLNSAMWKGKLYLWLRNSYSGTISISDSDVIGQVIYNPFFKKTDYYESLELQIQTDSEQDGANGRCNIFDEDNRLLEGDDKLPIWSNHGFGNWTETATYNDIDVVTGIDADIPVLAGYQTRWVLFNTTEDSYLQLTTGNFSNTLSDNSKLKVTFSGGKQTTQPIRYSLQVGSEDEYFVDLDTTELNTGKDYFNFEMPVKSSGNLKLRVKPKSNASKRIRYFGASKSLLEWQNHGFAEETGIPVDIQVLNCAQSSFDQNYTSGIVLNSNLILLNAAPYTTDYNWYDCETILSETSLSIKYGGSDTQLTWTNHPLSVGDWVRVENAAQSAFDGVYQVDTVYSSSIVGFNETPYTTDTSAYSCDVVIFPLVAYISNLNISMIKDVNKVISDFSDDDFNNVYPEAYYQNAAPDRESNYELISDILDTTQAANKARFGTEELKRLVMTVNLDTINPYSRVTYNSVNYWIEKMEFDFDKWTTSLTLTEAV